MYILFYFAFQESREGRHCFAAAAGHHEHRKPDRSPRGERGPVRTLVLLHLLPGFLPGILHLTAVLLSERRGQNYLCHVFITCNQSFYLHLTAVLLSHRRDQNLAILWYHQFSLTNNFRWFWNCCLVMLLSGIDRYRLPWRNTGPTTKRVNPAPVSRTWRTDGRAPWSPVRLTLPWTR